MNHQRAGSAKCRTCIQYYQLPTHNCLYHVINGRPRFYRLMKTQNRRYPRSSGMNGDKSGESGAFLFSRRVPDFCDGRRSFPTNENSNLYLRGSRLRSLMDLAHYQSPKLLGSSPPITNNRENLGQTSCEYRIYRQNLGWSEKGNSAIAWDFPDIWKPGLRKTGGLRRPWVWICIANSLHHLCILCMSFVGCFDSSFKLLPNITSTLQQMAPKLSQTQTCCWWNKLEGDSLTYSRSRNGKRPQEGLSLTILGM